MKTNYYILITVTGEKIPIKTKIVIKSLQIANWFSDETIRCFYPIDFIKFLVEGGY